MQNSTGYQEFKGRMFVLLFSLLLTSFSLSFPGLALAQGWKAGTAKVAITPSQPIWMAGYASREKPAEGKLHDLWAKALYLEDAGGNKALLVTVDFIGFTRGLSDRIKETLQARMGLSRAQIILSGTHTHSGPVLSESLSGIYPYDEKQQLLIDEYTRWFERKIVELSLKARNTIEPVNIYAQNGTVRFQVNRRNNKEAELTNINELKGPNDFSVPVLKIENLKGKIKSVLFGHACHPTVLSQYKWSGDYPGYAQLELEKRHKGATALFFQGAGADMNPLPRRSEALALQYGRELAAAVDRTLADNMKQLNPELAVAYSETQLKFDALPTKVELDKIANESKISYEKKWAKTMLDKLNRGESFPSSYPYPVQMWRMGDQLLAALGGELLVGYSVQLKKILGNDIFVMGYANDVMSYIPIDSELPKGGYEVDAAHRVYGLPAKWAAGIEDAIVGEAIKLATSVGINEKTQSITKTRIMTDKTTNQIRASNSLVATPYFSGFEWAHDTYNAISTASDGKVYYVLSSQPHDVAGQVHVYDPETDKTGFLADLTDICGEKDKKVIAQGKSHVRFYESNGKLYFSTHVGYYEMIDGMEQLPVNAPEGYKLYTGGHFLCYNLNSGKFEDLGLAPHGEGVLTMTMDTLREQIFAITWPKGYFVHLDLKTGKMHDLGLVSAQGEGGKVGDDYRVLCRSIFVDPRDGNAYFSTAEGDIYQYDPNVVKISKLDGVDLRIDYFGKYDHTRPGSMGYNWRSVVWYPAEQVAYGVHGNSGYLFKFDPRAKKIEIVDRITSMPSRKSGMFDQFSYGYLGFDLGYDKETIYYLTGGPIYIDGKRVKGADEIAMGAARGLENLHLITYHIPSGKYTDHGPIFYPDGSRPTYVNSIAIGKDGFIYTLARFEHQGKIVEDLVKIPNPLK